MKWFGIWILSFFLWFVISVAETYCRQAKGQPQSDAINEGAKTLKFGWLLTGFLILGIWCVRH